MSGFGRRQMGMGVSGMLVWLVMGGLILALGFKLVPSYAQFATVKSVMTSLANDTALQGKGRQEIMLNLSQRLGVNDIRGLPNGAFTVEQKGSDRMLVADYEVRVPLFFNIDAAMSFEHQAPLPRQ
jgi:hypothetical protein